MKNKSEIGIIGAGVMGSALAKNFANKNLSVSVCDIDTDKLDKLNRETTDLLAVHSDMVKFVESLVEPRKIILLLPDGKIIDECISKLTNIINKSDIIMDFGNSFYEDTNRRSALLKEKGYIYFGVGISGGEHGALTGPSIMPGGPSSSYNEIKPYLEKVAAHKNNEPCCSYIGDSGAGHFVKMVHNGIEYADMQLISEVYLFFKTALNKTNSEIADIFDKWNLSEVKSYLIEISAKVLRQKDPKTNGDLIDYIKDEASHKGTGKWTSTQSFELGINISTITSALQSRIISNYENERAVVNSYFEDTLNTKTMISIDTVKNAYYLAKVIAYAQGFSMISLKGKEEKWNLNLENIASVFRAGCIIQAQLLEIIKEIYSSDNDIANILLSKQIKNILIDNLWSLKEFNIEGMKYDLPMPVITSSLTYINQLKSNCLGANMVQGQRDFFGAHTFKRIDEEGAFHHEWK